MWVIVLKISRIGDCDFFVVYLLCYIFKEFICLRNCVLCLNGEEF